MRTDEEIYDEKRQFIQDKRDWMRSPTKFQLAPK